MCDYFWQRMENDQGDLADIVRPAGGGGRSGPSGAEFPVGDWQLPVEPMAFPPSSAAEEFGYSFAGLQDPLLDQLVSSNFLDGPNASAGMVKLGVEGGSSSSSGDGGGLVAQKMQIRSSSIFSRVLQISPGAVKASPLSPRAIEPPPPIVAGEHAAGMQIPSPRTPGIKRRKSQAKKVVCIPAPAAAGSRPSGEVVPSDLWAWRKYGQKPIKGSPYPRGYYRCSSSKGCSARKQVERSRTDPNMLVITYTSEHNHPWPTQRNALAGSTRSQPTKTSASKSSPHNPKPPIAMKEEPKEATTSPSGTPMVKEEAGEREKAIIASADDSEFDQVFHQGYKPMIPDSNQPDDFFAQLAELESDPMSLIFSKEMMEAKADEERGSDKAPLDQFNMFDWAGNSLGESAKKGL